MSACDWCNGRRYGHFPDRNGYEAGDHVPCPKCNPDDDQLRQFYIDLAIDTQLEAEPS